MMSLLLLLLAGAGVGAELTTWSNQQLTVYRTARPQEGEPLVIAAEHRQDRTRQVRAVDRGSIPSGQAVKGPIRAMCRSAGCTCPTARCTRWRRAWYTTRRVRLWTGRWAGTRADLTQSVGSRSSTRHQTM